ncbi:hydrolase 1, exosortase A system-associated [Methylovulum psychrotolerans]|uniref:Hydrolase 1, exosortase A system-associated n=1 Tax=Methylovulum psychrotolerans TaxID=1704499 RepID=A0A1Z4BVT6_9GAMM|nr:hydrolase 1, exosortase A system-associated [Methylovulum psychrotolerans]ASF45363.1 hydrolase 1, exosortase A system-associated [Methylovulum psychrotolerans]MBT9099425.1 hydrolase 1, exosortase A system-associated [Methylovulum psychrotolerans]POZ52240.1 hydrolase 1, exosortase A system-associated [Methylovulum psychrotolerans]
MTIKTQEIPLLIDCEGVAQIGIFHRPEQARNIGIVVVVAGGPQYRVGCARQIILWSRRLASDGYPVLRFDYRGFGDSAGEFVGFEGVNADIASAVDKLMALMPDLTSVVLWGECNAASAMMMYAWRDKRVSGLVMQNPWVRNEATQARMYIKHYYLMRIMQKSFWLKLLNLQFNPLVSMTSLVDLWRNAKLFEAVQESRVRQEFESLPSYQEKMCEGLAKFPGPVLLLMSGYSLIGKEFDELVSLSARWRAVLAAKALTRIDMPDADHTFSRSQDREKLVNHALTWLNQR